MGEVAAFLLAAESGQHARCHGCAWNPLHVGHSMAYGRSCLEHGVNWAADAKALSLQVVQDPGGTTPEDTGRLCFVCNSESPTDNTATLNYALWQAAVALSWDAGPIGPHSAGDRYLKRHFWTNCMMHGAPRKSVARFRQEEARRTCAPMILEQIRLLQPKVLIASGKSAALSFQDVGLLRAPWKTVRRNFGHGAYREVRADLNCSIHTVTILCTYHTSITAVNTHAARLYGEHTDRLIEERLVTLPDDRAAREFLKRYNNLSRDTDLGLRALLLHWLDIGDAIRDRGAEFEG